MSAIRKAQITAIHVLKGKAGLDDQSYRDMLYQQAGERSAAKLTEASAGKVIAHLNGLVGPMTNSGGTKRLDGPFGPKLQALWISGWQLGVVQNRDDAALLAFVKAQTSIEHTRFLRDARDARKAVEALKKWLTREAGVDWTAFDDPADCVLAAQLRLLGETRDSVGYTAAGVTGARGAAIANNIATRALMQLLGERIRAAKVVSGRSV